jgi:hypothetical protein
LPAEKVFHGVLRHPGGQAVPHAFHALLLVTIAAQG